MGARVGATEGGVMTGAAVGEAVGASVGAAEGASVGEAVGASVGAGDGVGGRTNKLGKEPVKPGFPAALKDKRASRYPMVVGMMPTRPKPLMSRPETRVAPPTVPHVTPVQALMPVTQGS